MTLDQAHIKAGTLANKYPDTEFCVVWDSIETGYQVAWPEELDTFFLGCNIVAVHHRSGSN